MQPDFTVNKNRVFDFIASVDAADAQIARDNEYKNSVDYKRNMLDKCQGEAKNVCLDAIFAKLYKDATPLSDDYKVANGEDLDVDCKDFFALRAPKGMDYYVRGMAESGNKVAKRLISGVDKIVHEKYLDMHFHPEKYTVEEMQFKLTDDIENKLDVLSKDVEFEDLAAVINDNVKQTAASEITRAKEEKEKREQLEAELANDINITSEAAIEEELKRRGYLNNKVYQPSLFNGMMIGYANKYNSEPLYKKESSSYGTIGMYISEGATMNENPCMTYAFIESVKEYTKLSILNALKFDTTLNYKNEVNELALKYASM